MLMHFPGERLQLVPTERYWFRYDGIDAKALGIQERTQETLRQGCGAFQVMNRPVASADLPLAALSQEGRAQRENPCS